MAGTFSRLRHRAIRGLANGSNPAPATASVRWGAFMARLTADQWKQARQRWEADPALTFEALADKLTVSRQAISKKAKADGWAKVASLRDVVEKAQFRADTKVANKVAAQVAQVAGATAKSDATATYDESVDIRADVIDRHRVDWAEHRREFAIAEIKTNFENGKKAKISAEMLLIRQKGERAAYGLEDNNAPPPTTAAETFKLLVAHLPD